eukprot:Skav204377  [mRNA]  locus=scaffold4897:75811:102111:- [translate_table: standard]
MRTASTRAACDLAAECVVGSKVEQEGQVFARGNIGEFSNLRGDFAGELENPTEIGDVCLYAGLHRFPAVCDILLAEYREYPELSCAMLTRISPVEETGLRPKQAVSFLKIFVALLQERALSYTGLKRLAIGLETALLMDSPKGLCGILAQREYELLADLLEALAMFQEAEEQQKRREAAVKQCMVVALTRTVGKHYKALPELDLFLLRILDMSIPLLDAEFTLYMPVLYKLALEGGRRVQGPMLSRQIHLRVVKEAAKSDAFVEKVHDRQWQPWGNTMGSSSHERLGW